MERKDAKKIFEKWDLDFVVIGKTTDTITYFKI